MDVLILCLSRHHRLAKTDLVNTFPVEHDCDVLYNAGRDEQPGEDIGCA